MKKAIYIINFFIGGYLLVIGLLFFTVYLWDKIETKNLGDVLPAVITQKPMPTTTSQNKRKLKIHATIPYWEQERASAVFRDNISKFDYLSVFWYTLNTNQKIVTYRDAEIDDSIVADAKQHNVKVLALITNLPENADWDSNRVRSIITSQQNRKAHIDDILRLLDEKQYDGVNIDYEELDDDLRDDFSAFIKELSAAAHLRNKLVAVAIHPKSAEFIPNEDNGSRAQDLSSLAESADHLYFMTYGEHWNTSAAGPVASIPWDEKIIAYAERLQLPMQKVFLGTPLYGVRWEKGTREGKGILFDDVVDLEQRFNIQPTWNEQWKSPTFTYTENRKQYEVWYENARSVEQKVKLAEKRGLGGVSFWHIGGEDPEVWKLF